MAQALAFAAQHRHLPAPEWLRRTVVCGCALALILAGPALPGL
jgi:hypothetical protein